MERLEFDLLFRWFVGIGVDDAAWDHSVFSKNRERLMEGDIAAKLLSAVLTHPRVKRLLSTDHFSVDGTSISVRGRFVRAILRLESLHRGPGFNQRAVDEEEMAGAQKPLHSRMCKHSAQQLGCDVAFQQARAVLGKNLVIPARVVDADADEPTEQQIELQSLHNCRSERIE